VRPFARWLFALAAILCVFSTGAKPYWQSRLQVSIASSVGCSQATTFLARTSGLDATHQSAYTTFICNLVAQGVWAKMDIVYVFATADTTTAGLNLVSTSFTGATAGSPTFTADAGYTGVNASTTVFFNSTFNPTTATTPQFTQNSSHVSAWSNTNAAAVSNGGVVVGLGSGAGLAAPNTSLFPKFNDGKAYYRINDGSSSAGVTNANSTGHYLANRSGASTQQGYKNAVDQGVVSQTSGTPANGPMYILAVDDVITGVPNPAFGAGYQVMMATIGGSLSAGDVTNLCHETNTYLNTIGGISSGIC